MRLVLPDIGIEPDSLMDDDRYFDFCQQNPKLRIERTAEGKIVVMPPTGFDSQDQELQAVRQLANWADKDGRAGGPADQRQNSCFPIGPGVRRMHRGSVTRSLRS